jgi:hypothetical protein
MFPWKASPSLSVPRGNFNIESLQKYWQKHITIIYLLVRWLPRENMGKKWERYETKSHGGCSSKKHENNNAQHTNRLTVLLFFATSPFPRDDVKRENFIRKTTREEEENEMQKSFFIIAFLSSRIQDLASPFLQIW